MLHVQVTLLSITLDEKDISGAKILAIDKMIEFSLLKLECSFVPDSSNTGFSLKEDNGGSKEHGLCLAKKL